MEAEAIQNLAHQSSEWKSSSTPERKKMVRRGGEQRRPAAGPAVALGPLPGPGAGCLAEGRQAGTVQIPR